MNNNRLAVITGLTVLVVLILGVVNLFLLRFKAGDIYPAYSSLRSDPIGTKALYQGLSECEGLSVSRNYRDLEKTDFAPGSTVLFLGDALSPHETILRSTQQSIDYFVSKGGRLVFTFYPKNQSLKKKKDNKKEESAPSSSTNSAVALPASSTNAVEVSQVSPTNAPSSSATVNTNKIGEINERMARYNAQFTNVMEWLDLEIDNVAYTNTTTASLNDDAAEQDLPASLSVHSSMVFTNLSDDWNVIYQRDSYPVIIEKKRGKGSIVLSSLSFFASNEAMRKERHPKLLSWIIGDNKTIVFDEHHHGITKNTSIGTLAREYKLQWLGLGLLVLAFLFIWQNGTSLVPPHEQKAASGVTSVAKGKDSAAGLTNLLRGNIRRGNILSTCVEEWGRTFSDPGKGKTASITDRVSSIMSDPSAPKSPVERYNEISKLVNKR